MNEYLDHYKAKKILITGGAGAIGSNLARRLAELDAGLVIILDDLSSSYRWNIPCAPNILFVEGSVTDDVVLKRVFNEEPSMVFHLAAFFANQNSVDYPERDLATNGMGTLKLLEYSRLAKVRRVVYASSGCSIYGSKAPMPLTEDFMSMHLSTPYQVTKMLGELYCNFFHHHYGLETVKARFFNSYGPGEVPGQYRNVIPNFLYWALKGRPLPITGNLKATRDYTYVLDTVDGLLRAGHSPKAAGKEFNLASGNEVSVGDLARIINRLTGNKAGTRMVSKRRWDTKDRILGSIERARKVLGYEPSMPFDEGLRRTLEWFKLHWEDIERSASFTGMSSAVRGQLTPRSSRDKGRRPVKS